MGERAGAEAGEGDAKEESGMIGFDVGPECHAEADKRASQQLPVMCDSNLADCGSIPHISMGVGSKRKVAQERK